VDAPWDADRKDVLGIDLMRSLSSAGMNAAGSGEVELAADSRRATARADHDSRLITRSPTCGMPVVRAGTISAAPKRG